MSMAAVRCFVLINVILIAGPSARASFSISTVSGGSALANATYSTFDSLSNGSAGGNDNGVAVSFTGDASAVQGSVANKYIAPILSGSNNNFFGSLYSGLDTTTYLQSGSGAVTLNFGASPIAYLGLLWGSVDIYNVLSFYNGSTLVGTITGTDVVNASNGTFSLENTAYVNIGAEPNSLFTSVVATTTLPGFTFEFDNVATSTTMPQVSVPEPSSLALCGMACLSTWLFRQARRRRLA